MLIDHLEPLVACYEGFIIDLWGVLHNGVHAFPDAIDFLNKLKTYHKKVILLSNAPRRLAPAQEKLTTLGILPHFYHHIYTSGEDCFNHLLTRSDPWYQKLGSSFYHIGPERDRHLFEDLDFKEACLEEADFLINTGTLRWDNTVEDFETVLQSAAKRHLPMVCPNPDKVVRFGEQQAICAGALAQRYAQLGGDVRYHGKPFPEIYEKVLKLFLPLKKGQILALGDSLTTDILGARQVGIDSVLVRNGIYKDHFKEDVNVEELLKTLINQYNIQPTYSISKVIW